MKPLKSLLVWWWSKRRRKWFTMRCGSRFVELLSLPSVILTLFQDAGLGMSSIFVPNEAEVSSSMMMEQEEKKVVHDAMWKQVCGTTMSPERAPNSLSGRRPWFNCAQ
jgi:hypothetical protein